jgi:Zn-dependent peptidase ImmA (M78 family)/transcriptional regulator with XRE-family HTH domain
MTMPVPLWGKTPTEVDLFGERLRDARVIQRRKAQDVAVEADLAPERYSRLENSLSTTVDAPRARRLARALDFPVGFLTSAPVTPVQRGSLLFRAKKGMTRGEEDQLVAWARLIGDLLHRAVQERVRLPYLKIPRADQISPATAAQSARRALGIDPDEPIPHLTRALERGGVYVASLDFSAELHAKHHDAFSTWVGPSLDWALIVVRSRTSWERTRLSIAHELGHLVMHHIRRDGNLESDAYSFASELLIPGSILRGEWPRAATLMSLMPLKRAWGISFAALIEAGYRGGLIDASHRINLYKQMSNRRDRQTGERWRIQEPGWRDREPERPKLIAKVLETAFDSEPDLATLSKFIYGWRPDFITQLLNGQVTPWAQRITLRAREADVDRQTASLIAPVIRLKREPLSQARPEIDGASSAKTSQDGARTNCRYWQLASLDPTD